LWFYGFALNGFYQALDSPVLLVLTGVLSSEWARRARGFVSDTVFVLC
jgi:hypothetical protein